MKRLNLRMLSGGAALAAGAAALGQITVVELGRYETGVFDGAAAEIVSYDEGTHRLFVVNGAAQAIDVLDASNPEAPTLLFSIDLAPWGAGPTSVTCWDGLVAVAVEADIKTDPGSAVFFDVDGNHLSHVTVGALPDMIVVTPDHRAVLTANEGEPNDDYTIDPVGSVSIIDVRGEVSALDQDDVTTLDFSAFENRRLPGVRIYGPGASVAQDIEPEYIAVDASSRYAFVTLQENNAIATVDIRNQRILNVKSLGYKRHQSRAGAFDASDRDDTINIRPWPVRGMFLPDAIATFQWRGIPLLITANEGDARDYAGFSEETRVKDLALDPVAFPHAHLYQADEALGRLKTTTANGDPDDDGLHEHIHSFGGRSFSIWSPLIDPIYDSGDEFEQITAGLLPDDFNSNNDENGSFDGRSDDKGPEPEALTIGEIDGRSYAFIGLERIGGIMIYEITNPLRPRFVDYFTNRDFDGDPELGTAGDLGPEGIIFIPPLASPNGEPLIVVANEISGSTTILAVRPQ